MRNLLLIWISVLVVGCATPTRQQLVTVETNEPGAKVEVGTQLIGESPTSFPISVDEKGRLRVDDGSYLTVTAYPVRPQQWTQHKILEEGKIAPTRIYFDLNLQPDPRVQKKVYDINF